MIRIIQIFSILALVINTSLAIETIRITKGNAESIPIAINNFEMHNDLAPSLSNKISEIIKYDLMGSGMFKPISKSAFIENKIGVGHAPLFEAWQQINANLLINASIKPISGNKIQIQFILWDSFLGRDLLNETLELPKSLWRRAAHTISDLVYKKITGYEGYFNSRIAYVSETGSYLKRIKRLAIMDQDGANHRYLTDGSDLVLTPRFSPDSKSILYLSYKNIIPQVHLMDIRTKKSKLIGEFSGMSFAPRFAPDGKNAIFSIAKNGQTNIFEINLRTKKLKQLTKGAGIDTSPSYSPDGKRIVFNSDRYGARQLFIMNRNGSNVKRISFGGGVYAEPNWSKRNLITYTKISREIGGFTIGVMNPDSGENENSERIITKGYLVESPTWANNGRVIAYTRGISPKNRNLIGLNRIYSIDFTGYNERILPTPHDASDPDWSMLLD